MHRVEFMQMNEEGEAVRRRVATSFSFKWPSCQFPASTFVCVNAMNTP